MLDETHAAGRTSWVAPANGHAAFPIQNLPFGIFSTAGDPARGGVAIGDAVPSLSWYSFRISTGPSSKMRRSAVSGASGAVSARTFSSTL